MRSNGFGHEWWNFFEFDDTPYYYGYLQGYPKSEKFDKPALMIFVSKKNKEEKLRLVGFYSDFDYNQDTPTIKDISQTGIPYDKLKIMEEKLKSYFESEGKHTPEKIKILISEDLTKVKYKLVVKRENATIFPGYSRHNVKMEDLTKIGHTFINYIEGPKINDLIERLEIWKKHIEKDTTPYYTPYEEMLEITPITPFKSLVTQRAGQKIFSRNVLKKDSYECKICGIKERNFLEAAHIVDWKVDEVIAGDPFNGITLCRNHHKAFDSRIFYFAPGDAPDKNGIVDRWIFNINPKFLKNTELLECLLLTGKNGTTIYFKANKEYFDIRNNS